jgi:putative addiction module killer protein
LKNIEYFETPGGKRPFKEWINKLEEFTVIKIRAYIDRVAAGGSKMNVKPIEDGVFEISINFGPGYRVYFGQTKNMILLLLVGGDKSSQDNDIKKAKEYWRLYESK